MTVRLMNSGRNPEVCDATKFNRSTKAGNITKIPPLKKRDRFFHKGNLLSRSKFPG